jgi:hypothetical protein
MNKFKEMNYLVDKLQDKKQKELKRITSEVVKWKS